MIFCCVNRVETGELDVGRLVLGGNYLLQVMVGIGGAGLPFAPGLGVFIEFAALVVSSCCFVGLVSR